MTKEMHDFDYEDFEIHGIISLKSLIISLPAKLQDSLRSHRRRVSGRGLLCVLLLQRSPCNDLVIIFFVIFAIIIRYHNQCVSSGRDLLCVLLLQ